MQLSCTAHLLYRLLGAGRAARPGQAEGQGGGAGQSGSRGVGAGGRRQQAQGQHLARGSGQPCSQGFRILPIWF